MSAGYFSVWAMVGLVVYPLGVVIADSAMRWRGLARCVPFATGVVLMLAGCWQLTGWKARQLERCLSAPACNQSVRPDAWSACRHGVYLGTQCVLSCFNLMLVLLMSGVMDLAAMAVVMGAITAERIVPWPRRAARAAGLALLVLGTLKILGALSRAA